MPRMQHLLQEYGLPGSALPSCCPHNCTGDAVMRQRCLMVATCAARLCQQLAMKRQQTVADNERLRLQLLLHGAGLPPHGVALPAHWPQLLAIGSAVKAQIRAAPAAASRAALTIPASLLAGPQESAAPSAA